MNRGFSLHRLQHMGGINSTDGEYICPEKLRRCGCVICRGFAKLDTDGIWRVWMEHETFVLCFALVA